jgi:hypothetical protein
MKVMISCLLTMQMMRAIRQSLHSGEAIKSQCVGHIMVRMDGPTAMQRSEMGTITSRVWLMVMNSGHMEAVKQRSRQNSSSCVIPSLIVAGGNQSMLDVDGDCVVVISSLIFSLTRICGIEGARGPFVRTRNATWRDGSEPQMINC